MDERAADDRDADDRDADDVWPLDSARALAVASRSARRRLRLSQRALAARAGVGHATVARIEAEHDVSFGVVLAVLRAVGAELVVLGPPVDERPEDSARDTGGRRLPAHLDARLVDLMPVHTHMRRSYRGGPLLRRPGEYWTFTRPYPWPGDVTPGG